MKTTEENSFTWCKRHGRQPLGVVCRHLGDGGKNQGFYNPDDMEPDHFSAWCEACNELLHQIDFDWSLFDRTVRLVSVCAGCFARIRKDNSVLRVD